MPTREFLLPPGLQKVSHIFVYPHRISGIALLDDQAALSEVYHKDILEGQDTTGKFTSSANVPSHVLAASAAAEEKEAEPAVAAGEV